jgi:hypothetical protein
MAVKSQSYRTLFNKTNITASHFVYNTSKYVSATTGWVSSKYDSIIVQTRLATKTNADTCRFIYKVEGKFDGLNRPASIYVNSLTSVQNADQLITVSEKVKEIRLLAKTSRVVGSISASPCVFYAGVCLTETF